MTKRHPGIRKTKLARRLFPDRQIHLRTAGRVSFFRLSHGLQLTILALFLLTGAWMTFASVSYMLHDKVLAAKDAQIASAHLAYRSLLGEVAGYQNKFSSITRDLEENHAMMLGLVEKNAALQQNLKSVANQLNSTEQEKNLVIGARKELKKQLAEIDYKMSSLSSRNYTLKDSLDSTELDLQTALAERNKALFESTRMRRHIRNLEVRLVDLQKAEEESVKQLTDRTTDYIGTMEKVIKLTGLKVKRLLSADNGLPRGRGGPFIEVKPDDLPANRLKANLRNLDSYLRQSAGLQGIMAKLPLTAPLNSFYITSGFGKRRDPINKRWAAHYGVDLGNVFKSSVYATAPGVVTYSGWKGKYGKLVEVSHGAGLKTRYGHLNKILVRKGEKISFRQKIGLLGSTGRSTGAHLHYEVLFKNRYKNPMKFIKAGRYVFQN
ncbi:MAG: peptidoglycan DD-metalloendopeptidase family protein [Proteobacteria bacterium]|nr:peptidoglycan DD-metalloendopeptidase family protein [Pseudomonadota bacterium]